MTTITFWGGPRDGDTTPYTEPLPRIIYEPIPAPPGNHTDVFTGAPLDPLYHVGIYQRAEGTTTYMWDGEHHA